MKLDNSFTYQNKNDINQVTPEKTMEVSKIEEQEQKTEEVRLEEIFSSGEEGFKVSLNDLMSVAKLNNGITGNSDNDIETL